MQPPRCATENQKLYLLAYMEKNVHLSQGEFYSLQGKEDLAKDWDILTQLLNDITEGCKKSAAKWQDVSRI